MNRVLDIAVAQILPTPEAILLQQGVPGHASGQGPLATLAGVARQELAEVLEPAGVLVEVTRHEFDGIYPGSGFNDSQTPLAEIYPRADHLALFAVTCGPRVCHRINRLFTAHDYPLAAALDAAASLAADQAAQVAEDRFAAILDDGMGVLRYSPGYCGWHVSGQRALFARLGDRAAGITLTESCLMHPLKSVSGVIVAGRPEIHRFDNDYPFCEACTDKECRGRIRTVLASPEKEI